MTQNNGNNNQQGIINSWSLIAFARSHGKMQVGEFANKETGEVFKSCIFTDPADSGNRCFVAFSSKMGELTPREIAAANRVRMPGRMLTLACKREKWGECDRLSPSFLFPPSRQSQGRQASTSMEILKSGL